MNQYACAITGHRPTRFCFGYNEEDPLCQKLKECLLEQFRILHDEKFVCTFFVGGALGVDMWAGEQLLTLRAQTGYEDIKIIVVVPFIGYDSKWPDQSKHRLKKLIQNANDSIVISHSADVSSYKKEIIIWSIMQSTLSVCLIIRKSCAPAQHRQSIMPYGMEKQSL
nr:SLOG family protein [Clostridium sp. AM32-2]